MAELMITLIFMHLRYSLLKSNSSLLFTRKFMYRLFYTLFQLYRALRDFAFNFREQLPPAAA
jgi:hypothetical protein